MEFSRREYWSGLPFSVPGDLSLLGIEPEAPASWALAGKFITRVASQVVKNPPASAGDTGVIPNPGRSPEGGNGNPLQFSCLGNPTDIEAWQAAVGSITKELDNTERLNNSNEAENIRWLEVESCPAVGPSQVMWTLPWFQGWAEGGQAEVTFVGVPSALQGWMTTTLLLLRTYPVFKEVKWLTLALCNGAGIQTQFSADPKSRGPNHNENCLPT